MKRLRTIFEHLIESLLTVSGAITTLTILLVTLFLFTEGAGFFRSSSLEEGQHLYVHQQNPIRSLNAQQIKAIYDGEITNWASLGGKPTAIELLSIDDLINNSTVDLGDQFAHLPTVVDATMAQHPGGLLLLPDDYAPSAPQHLRAIDTGTLSLSDFFAGSEWLPTASPAALYGALPLLSGTLLVSFVAILISLPIGVGVAIYLVELASPRLRRIFRPAIELLAGIPSVVYGFWGLVVLVPGVQQLFQLPVGETALTGSLVLAIMALPTIISIAQDALANTPRALREASLALGATHWQTICRVVVPYARSGILAAMTIGIGRAVGETMAVLMVTGNAAVIPRGLTESVRTIPATIVAELGEVPVGSTHYQALFLLGGILFLFTTLTSIITECFVQQRQNAIH